jgi:hypothetical protein
MVKTLCRVEAAERSSKGRSAFCSMSRREIKTPAEGPLLLLPPRTACSLQGEGPDASSDISDGAVRNPRDMGSSGPAWATVTFLILSLQRRAAFGAPRRRGNVWKPNAR